MIPNATAFEYIDVECEFERPVTLDNLMLAYSAEDWLNIEVGKVVDLCRKYKHPELKKYWAMRCGCLDEIHGISSVGIRVVVLYYRGYNESDSVSLTLPLAWFGEGGEACLKSDIANMNAIIVGSAQVAKSKNEAAKEAMEFALYKALHNKYANV